MSVVRFAPSPTGTLHIGGARTALFNWLHARQSGGKFILRIDDTDTDRSTQDSLDSIVRDLKWLGLDWDLGPGIGDPKNYQASLRNDIYLKYANQLIDSGHAYMDSNDTIKIKMNFDSDIVLNDILKGKVIFPKDAFADFIIIRSNKIATYNFATVIDDHLMGVTDIYRADEHLVNTPKQIAVYQALNWTLPKFGHMSLITGSDGKKLSKRDGSSSVGDFNNLGILPSALMNYLAFLGWGLKSGDSDILSQADLLSKFNMTKVKNDPAMFDLSKLIHINSQHMKNLTPNDIANIIQVDDLSFATNFQSIFGSRWKTTLDTHKNYNQLTNDPVIDIALLDFIPKDTKLKILDTFRAGGDLSIFNKRDYMSLLRMMLIGAVDGPQIDFLISLIPKKIVSKRLDTIYSMIL